MSRALEGSRGAGSGRDHLAPALWRRKVPIFLTGVAIAAAGWAGASLAPLPARMEMEESVRALIGIEPPSPQAIAIVVAAGGAGILLLALLVLARRLRAGRTSRGAAAGRQGRTEPPIATRAGVRMAYDLPVTTAVGDLAEAIGAARISRIFLAGTTAANRDGAVALARCLAQTGAATILVDLEPGAEAVRSMGSLDAVEDVATMAASPTSFAHAIHRDRQSAVHTMAADISVPEGERAATIEAVATVLQALSIAYVRTVVAAGRLTAAEMRDLTDKNTAIVVPVARSEERLALAALEELSADGRGEIILMSLDEAEARSAAA